MDEIENAVPAGIHPGDERRPGDRALRRHGGAQRPESPGVDQALEIRHYPFLDVAQEELRRLVI